MQDNLVWFVLLVYLCICVFVNGGGGASCKVTWCGLSSFRACGDALDSKAWNQNIVTIIGSTDKRLYH